MIEHLVATLVDTAARHWLLAYVLVGLMAAAETLPIAGTLVPGSVLIVGISALVPSGALAVWPLIVAAILGAVAGDGLSFWLGRRYQHRLAAVWPLRRYPGLVARAEALFRRHGGKSVFFARFVQGPRAFVPVVAGMSDMPPARFYAFNTASALLWASSHVLAGVTLGASLQLVAAIAGRLALLLVLVAAVVWLAMWLARRVILGLGLPALVRLQGRVAQWAAAADSGLKRRLLVAFRSEPRELGTLLLSVVLLAGSLWLFLGILEDLVTGDPLVRANGAVFHFLQGLRTQWGDRFMVAVTEMGDGTVTTAVTLAVAGWLLWRRAWRAAAYWLAAVTGAAVFTPLIKYAVHWPRPTALYSGWEAFSFPSGHATINATLYGFLGFLAARELRPRWWPGVIGGLSALVAVIAVSRLYLGAHWLADVVAGIAMATAWVTLLALAYARRHPQPVGAASLLGVAALSLVVAWGVHSEHRFEADLARYTPAPQQRQLSLAAWRAGGYRQLPARRIDLGGEGDEPLTLQWLGGLAALQGELGRAGWQASAPWTPINAARWLEPAAPAVTLPVLPKLHDGRPPALRLIHPDANETDRSARVVLLVWPTNITVTRSQTGRSRRLWLGSVVEQCLHHPLGLMTVARAQPSINAMRDRLAADLAGATVVKRATAAPGSHWDGQLILAASPPPAAQQTP